MEYTLSFNIAGIIIIFFVLLAHNVFYPIKNKINIFYILFGIYTIIAMFFNILYARVLYFIDVIPTWLAYTIFNFFFTFCVVASYSGTHYIFHRINKRTKVGLIIDRSLAIIYILLLLLNHLTGWIFTIKDHVITHGVLFNLTYFVIFGFITHATIIIIKYRKEYEKDYFALNISFLIINYIGAIIQIIYPDIMIAFFCTSISFLILLFSLETPEYQKMQSTLANLEKSKIEEERAKKEAINANKAKSNFLAEMSHEIRTPINTIMGLNDMILRDSSEQQIIEFATKIKNANTSLLETINDILDLSKIESGKMSLNLAEYKLSELIVSLVNMIKLRAEQKNLEFKLTINETMPSGLIGDYTRIKQIIINLLTNAVKYTNEGYVELVFDGYTKKNKFFLNVKVIDTGIGIKKENIEKALSAFERLDSTKNRDIEGTGLGLNIVQQFLKLMNSSIKVQSVYNKGSTFSFEIEQKIYDETPIGKIDETQLDKKKADAYQVSFIAPDAKILAVDDTEINLYVIEQLLKETEIKIAVAKSGKEALKLVKFTHFDLILLDHMMPGMDGIETLKHIKEEDNLCQTTPIVALTANAISGSEEMYLSHGFSGYISKPINQDRMERIISSLLPPELIKPAPLRKRRQSTADANLPEIDGMDTAYAMSHFYSKEMFMDVLKNYYITLPQNTSYIEQLTKDLDKEDTEILSSLKSLQIAVHTMKSSSALVGMAPISGIARLCEQAAIEEDINKIIILSPLLTNEMHKMKKSLDQIFKVESDKKPIDNNMLKAFLFLLQSSFKSMNVDKLDEIMSKLGEFSYPPEVQELIDSLMVDVSNLDEKNGTEHIKKISEFLK